MKELIDKLRRENIHLSLIDSNLKLSFDEEPELELLEEIKSQKKNLVAYMEQQTRITGVIEKVGQRDVLISPNQVKLWVIDKLSGKSNLYNIPAVYTITGSMSISSFEKAWDKILMKHEILRTIFIEKDDNHTYQIISEKHNPTEIIDAQTWSIHRREEYIKTICKCEFDLQEGPLCLSVLLKIGSEEFVWVLNFHHIIFDGWSSGIFLNQFKVLYDQFQLTIPDHGIVLESELQ
jgi:hypothetical protein